MGIPAAGGRSTESSRPGVSTPEPGATNPLRRGARRRIDFRGPKRDQYTKPFPEVHDDRGSANRLSVSFGLPDTPDLPDVPDVPEMPEIDIPGIAILDEIALKLDELGSSVADFETILPELAAIDRAADKLREINDADPEVAAILEDLEILQGPGTRSPRAPDRGSRQDQQLHGRCARPRGRRRSEINDFVETIPGLGSAQI